MKNEEWRDVVGFPGYRVSSRGRVMSSLRGKWRRLGCRPNTSHGYCRIKLMKDGVPHNKFVHILVLEAFQGPCPTGMQACHYPDKNPANNRASNLRWDTPKENARDKAAHGTQPKGERCGQAKLTDHDVLMIRSGALDWMTCAEMAKRFGVTANTISYIRRGLGWAHVAGGKRRNLVPRWSQRQEKSILDVGSYRAST